MSPANGVPTWLVLIFSSALISALVKVASGAISKWWDHRREDQKEKERVAHIYFDIALQLEQFAQETSIRVDEIYGELAAYHRDLDDSALGDISIATLSFYPLPAWEQLPIKFAATVKAFSNGTAQLARMD